MLNWFKRHSEDLSALSGVVTAIAALLAVAIIPYQLRQADRIQRDQTAREIYREFLSLSVQKPELATADYCTMTEPTKITAYGAYVDYLLYTAEQMVETSDTWRAPMATYVAEHMTYICADEAHMLLPEIRELVADLGLSCKPENSCR